MSVITTYDRLREWSSESRARILIEKAQRKRPGATTFLAHSSKDLSLLPGVVLILQNHGAEVYVDRADDRMPETTNRETAKILRDTISDSDRVVMFVTENSKDSKWVPWELGLGDGIRGAGNVALFPAAEYPTSTEWLGSEYLGLYGRITWGRLQGHEKPLWMVENHVENTAMTLEEWLTRTYVSKSWLSYA